MDEKQERNLARLVRNDGFQFIDTFFPYTSGEIGPYYVQSAVVLNNGKDYSDAVEDMTRFMIASMGVLPDVISGGESRDWCFSFPIAAHMGKPHAMLYKDGKFIGPDIKGKNVVHVADLSNEGSSPRDLWVPAIRQRGGNIGHIFFYVDRMEDGPGVMKELGLESHALVPLNQDAWDYLVKQGVVGAKVYANLRERGTTKEERDDWAIKMLKSEAGMKRFKELAEKTPDKAKKIIKTYPIISDELKKNSGLE